MTLQNFLNTTTHNVSWFANRHNEDKLELSAPFQRNPVWSPRQKAYLIDTILRGFPIPELYMQEFANAEGQDRYVVVDGQQRLRACLEFLDGQVTFDPEDSPDFADMGFADLNAEQKKSLYNYSFVVRILPEMPEADLRGMFQRLNRNVVALNPQELRHATYWGQFITSAEKVSGDDRWSVCRLFTPNDIRRMLDIEFVSELMVAYLHGVQNKKTTLEDWYQAYEVDFPRRDETEAVFEATLGEMASLMPVLESTRWRKKSDFYSLFLVLAKSSNYMPFSRDGRAALKELLRGFAEQVDSYLENADEFAGSDEAKKYAKAVERAASDLANRRERETQITELLRGVLTDEAAAAGAVG